MPKTCKTCGEHKALNRDNWWRDARYPDGWCRNCKTCARIQMRQRADSRMEMRHCVICNKLFPCYPDTSKRYRLTCSKWHQRTLMSNTLLVRYGKRPHQWNYYPDGRSVLPGDKPVATEVPYTFPWEEPELDHPGLFNPFA